MILIRHGQSEFNVHYGRTRQDPGIRDPVLTEEGRAQAHAAAATLGAQDLRRLVTSPYRRALETAEIIADALRLPVTVDPTVGERAAFSCDFGSAPVELARRWPAWSFGHLPEQWWPAHEEPEAGLLARCARFRTATDALEDRDHVAIVSHWGFIRALTGLAVPNAAAVRFRIRPEPAGEVVHPG
jgi:glucosyl-3-phosphoglycerate phosphatase